MFHIFTINAINPVSIAGSILVTWVLFHLMLGSNQNFPAFLESYCPNNLT